MNYGLVLPEGTAPKLEARDELDRLCIQLYERVASAGALRDARVLEVGSGRGGGASYLARYHWPAEMTGLDFSSPAVGLCRRQHGSVANLKFQSGDAEAYPAVCRWDLRRRHQRGEQSLLQASRNVFPRGGPRAAARRHFSLRGLPKPSGHDCARSDAQCRDGVAARIAREDITAGVFAALEADDGRKRRLIGALPKRMRGTFEEFAGLAGSEIFEGLRSRTLIYFRFAYEKGGTGRELTIVGYSSAARVAPDKTRSVFDATTA